MIRTFGGLRRRLMAWRKPPVATSDPRWQALMSQGLRCNGCNDLHRGLFDLAYARPDSWPGPEVQEPNELLGQALAEGRDILTEDFCLQGDHRILRSVLQVPIRETDQALGFGVWCTVPASLFDTVIETFDLGTQGRIGGCSSWLMSVLPGAERTPARGNLTFRDGRQRPLYRLTDAHHPWFQAQEEGLTIDGLFALYRDMGHLFAPQ